MGKTGTAEVKKHHKDADDKDVEKWNPSSSHAWFAGWAPAEDPELAIVVMVEHGGAGGTNAWPIAQRILDQYFAKKSQIRPEPKVWDPAKRKLGCTVPNAPCALAHRDGQNDAIVPSTVAPGGTATKTESKAQPAKQEPTP
jgi:hypothetical protein